MTSLASFALCLAAFTALSVAMERHHAQVFGAVRARRPFAWRSLGWALLAASVAYAIYVFGFGIGLVMWCGSLTLAGGLVAWLLPYRPRWLLSVTSAMSVAALLAWAVKTAA